MKGSALLWEQGQGGSIEKQLSIAGGNPLCVFYKAPELNKAAQTPRSSPVQGLLLMKVQTQSSGKPQPGHSGLWCPSSPLLTDPGGSSPGQGSCPSVRRALSAGAAPYTPMGWESLLHTQLGSLQGWEQLQSSPGLSPKGCTARQGHPEPPKCSVAEPSNGKKIGQAGK